MQGASGCNTAKHGEARRGTTKHEDEDEDQQQRRTGRQKCTPSPQELVKKASLAARLQDLDIIRLEAGVERREPAQWDELRVWDPGNG